MSTPKVLQCTPCFAKYQEHKSMKLEGKAPKIKDAAFIYQGSSMCKSHFVDIVNTQIAMLKAEQTKLIHTPGPSKLTLK